MQEASKRDSAKPARTGSKPEPEQPSSPSPNAVQPGESPAASKPGQNPGEQAKALEKNVPGKGGQAEGHPGQPAGQHATGSFAGQESPGTAKK